MHEMNRRAAAVRAVQARFADRPFAWGSVDCVKVGAWHLRLMGHKLPALAKAGRYRSALGARAALKRAGFADLAAALDATALPEIPPAAALIGDIVLLPGTDGWQSLCIVMGAGTVLGFHEEWDVLSANRIDASAARAWRV